MDPYFNLSRHPSNIYWKEPFLNKDFSNLEKVTLSDQRTACAVVVIEDKNCYVNCFISSTENFPHMQG